MTAVRLPAAAVAGGALGAILRHALTVVEPTPSGHFPWTVLAINVTGSALLAALPAWRRVRTSEWLAIFLGTGLLGGFTTMSAAAVAPVHTLGPGPAGAYVVATLAGALGSVWVVQRMLPGAHPPREAIDA